MNHLHEMSRIGSTRERGGRLIDTRRNEEGQIFYKYFYEYSVMKLL